jgi:hypothetical protein
MIWIFIYVISAAIAVALSVPIVSFLLVMFSFGLFYLVMVGVGLVALLAPLAIVIHAGIAWLGRVSWRSVVVTFHIWACALIFHVGASYGQSRWGDVGGMMGAKNMPFTESFLSPIIFLVGLGKSEKQQG